MPSTSRDSAALAALAQAEFAPLSPAERSLVDAANTSALACCGLTKSQDLSQLLSDPSYLPEFSEQGSPSAHVNPWSPDRNVRAELLRWLCVNREAKALINAAGIQLIGARIVGRLDLSWTEIPFRVSLKRCRLKEQAFFIGCRILVLDLEGSWTGPINADTIRVQQNLNLRWGFHADGLVSLVGAQIGADLGCGESVFIGHNGIALNADSATVGGAVLLRAGSSFNGRPRPFRAEGAVRMEAARIGGDLDCVGGVFHHPYAKPDLAPAIDLTEAEIKGTLYLRAHTGERDIADLPLQVDGLVNLQGASAGGYEDDRACWKTLRLNLYGFVYNRITSEPRDASYARDAGIRLAEWLSLDVSGAAQPYRQLAKVLADTGDAAGSKQVYEAMEAMISQRDDRPPVRWAKASIGYGYAPERAFYMLGALTAVGWLLYWRSYRMNSMIPTDKDAALEFKKRRTLPDSYARFSPFFGSLENTFPLISFGQADKWQADPQPAPLNAPARPLQRFLAWTATAGFMRTFIRIQIILGWLFATLFVAGVSGIVKHD